MFVKMLCHNYKQCRVCLNNSAYNYELSSVKVFGKTFYDLVTACSGLQMQPNNLLPSCICTNCSNLLTMFYTFKRLIVENDCKLRTVVFGDTCKKDGICGHDETHNFNLGRSDFLHSSMIDMTRNFMNIINPEFVAKHTADLTHDPGKKMKFATVLFGCDKCDQFFMEWEHLQLHNQKRHQSSAYEWKGFMKGCRYCGEYFNDQSELPQHISSEHSDLLRFQCGYCGRKKENEKNLRAHIVAHYVQTEVRSVEVNTDAEIANSNFYDINQDDDHMMCVEVSTDSPETLDKNINELCKETQQNECILENAQTQQSECILKNAQTQQNERILKNVQTQQNERTLENAQTQQSEYMLKNAQTQQSESIRKNYNPQQTILKNDETQQSEFELKNILTQQSECVPKNAEIQQGERIRKNYNPQQSIWKNDETQQSKLELKNTRTQQSECVLKNAEIQRGECMLKNVKKHFSNLDPNSKSLMNSIRPDSSKKLNLFSNQQNTSTEEELEIGEIPFEVGEIIETLQNESRNQSSQMSQSSVNKFHDKSTICHLEECIDSSHVSDIGNSVGTDQFANNCDRIDENLLLIIDSASKPITNNTPTITKDPHHISEQNNEDKISSAKEFEILIPVQEKTSQPVLKETSLSIQNKSFSQSVQIKTSRLVPKKTPSSSIVKKIISLPTLKQLSFRPVKKKISTSEIKSLHKKRNVDLIRKVIFSQSDYKKTKRDIEILQSSVEKCIVEDSNEINDLCTVDDSVEIDSESAQVEEQSIDTVNEDNVNCSWKTVSDERSNHCRQDVGNIENNYESMNTDETEIKSYEYIIGGEEELERLSSEKCQGVMKPQKIIGDLEKHMEYQKIEIGQENTEHQNILLQGNEENQAVVTKGKYYPKILKKQVEELLCQTKKERDQHNTTRCTRCCTKTSRDKSEEVDVDEMKKFKCGFCSKMFFFERTLTVHLKSHVAQLWSCDCCGLQFLSSDVLKLHHSECEMNQIPNTVSSTVSTEDIGKEPQNERDA